MEEKRSKKAFQVIDGGKKTRVEGNEGGPAFGSGIKAEETRGLHQPLTPEEIEELHSTEMPEPPKP